ncbi:MAG: SIS domain-containing protein [Opitutaceae bacterium]|nr:SIS domain-containing protein [Opitutaceae bacterium]
MKTHLAELLARRPELVVCAPTIHSAYTLLRDCFRSGGRIYLCGNGGSAADCEHWAGELLKGFYSKRPSRRADGRPLPRELRGLQGGLPAIPLTGFLSLRTAVANDIDPTLEYAQLVWALGRPGDVLVGISTSGNARNVGLAARAAKLRRMTVVGLSGAHGGKLRDLADPCLRVPATQTHLIQEQHLAIYHTLCLALEDEFFSK